MIIFSRVILQWGLNKLRTKLKDKKNIHFNVVYLSFNTLEFLFFFFFSNKTRDSFLREDLSISYFFLEDIIYFWYCFEAFFSDLESVMHNAAQFLMDHHKIAGKSLSRLIFLLSAVICDGSQWMPASR